MSAAVLVPIGAGLTGLVVGALAAARLGERPLSSVWRPRVERRRDVVVPVLSAVCGVLMGLRFGPSAALAPYLYLALVGIVLAAIDVEQHRLPDRLTLPSVPITFALLAIALPFVPDGGHRLLAALAGMAALAALYGVLFVIKPDGMGFGDVKLAGLLGVGLGWLGVDAWVLGAFFGVLFGGVFALALIVARRANRKTMIPFGPFMIAGALVAILVSGQLVG